MTRRRLTLAGPANFRDLGGYEVPGDRHVRWGRLYRSDSLHTITPEDIPTLEELGVRTAIDFRSSDELDRLGIGPLGEFTIEHVHCPTFDGNVQTVRPQYLGKSAAEFYALMLESGASAYVTALDTLASTGSLPAVFFCVAGKDRTGCFAAIVLGLLGVSDDDIVEDYALTQEILPILTERRVARDGHDVEAERWKDIPSDLREARAHVMRELVGIVHDQWGDWEGYARAVDVSPDVVARLRAELLSDGTR
jgi:protein-tyrosine phosphatase